MLSNYKHTQPTQGLSVTFVNKREHVCMYYKINRACNINLKIITPKSEIQIHTVNIHITNMTDTIKIVKNVYKKYDVEACMIRF